MITWNYRVFQESEGDYVIREVFYAEDGTIIGCTENSVEPIGRTLAELAQSIDDFRNALQLPVLTINDIPQLPKSPKKGLRSNTTSHEQIRAQLGLIDPNHSEKGTS